jgi:hypothetical protein
VLNWFEWDGQGLPEDRPILYSFGWHGQVDGLLDAIVAQGWLANRRVAEELIDPSKLQVGWYGYRDSERVPEACAADGESLLGDGGYVEMTLKMTWFAVV